MKILVWLSILVFAASVEARDVSHYNLSSTGTGVIHHTSNIAYDPVSYFPEANGSPQKGLKEFAHIYENVEYLFSSQKNKELFISNPEKYEPTYGGYCARAMAVGQKVEVDPKVFILSGNRLHLFINKRAKRVFERNFNKLEADADNHWLTISGEKPRK